MSIRMKLVIFTWCLINIFVALYENAKNPISSALTELVSNRQGRVMYSTVPYREGTAPAPPTNLIVPHYLIWENPQWRRHLSPSHKLMVDLNYLSSQMLIDLIELVISKNLVYLVILIIFVAWDCAKRIWFVL